MADLADFVVGPADSIEVAMRQIEANHHRAVVVVDEQQRVLGVVSDGDVRRALLRGLMQISPVGKIMNVHPITTAERDPARWNAILHERKITLLPVVDGEGRLVDVGLAYDPL